ncbi:MAG: alpha/beta hydrolase-fold protein [Pirellulales bacterium]
MTWLRRLSASGVSALRDVAVVHGMAVVCMAFAAQAGAADAVRVAPAVIDGRGVHVHRVESTYQSGPTLIRVLLPCKQKTRLAVLYVLPVEPGTESRYGDALEEVLDHDLHNRYGLVCVLPTFSDLPWYADHASDPAIRQESYLLEAVLPFIERTYPVKRVAAGRLLVGFSKSGWGALSLLLRYPDVFGKAAAWDAPLMLDEPGEYGTQPIFGTTENFRRYQITRLLDQRAGAFRHGKRIILNGYAAFGHDHEQLHERMTELGVSHVYRVSAADEHNWHSGWLPEAVALLMQTSTASRRARK